MSLGILGLSFFSGDCLDKDYSRVVPKSRGVSENYVILREGSVLRGVDVSVSRGEGIFEIEGCYIKGEYSFLSNSVYIEEIERR